MRRIDNLIAARRKKLVQLIKLGVDPYPPQVKRTHACNSAKKKIGKKVWIAGRIKSLRRHGGVTFADLVDASGKIQALFVRDRLGEKKYKILALIDVGDFVAVGGKVGKTKAGEITVFASDFQIAAKAIRPLPDSWYGLSDVESRYRKRYLDLLMNPQVKKVFLQRTKIIKAMREFLDKRGFVEVETPTLQPIYGGASARPFVTHHNALDIDLYLKISDELYLKRLIIGGFEKVYEIDHDFRNEGIDKTHNPEFTMMECYWAWADYEDMMRLTEKMIAFVAKKVLGTTKIEFQGKKIDLTPPWRRLSMFAAIRQYLGWDPEKISDKELQQKLQEKGKKLPGGYNRGLAIAELFEEVEPKLIQPTFITDFPKETTALCKLHRQDPRLIERFEPYIAGWEIGNAYSELNDPILQRQLFEEQNKRRQAGDEEAHPMDEDFVEALEYGMPPTGGLGIGVDRLVMILTNQPSIRDVILFPTLRPK